MTYKDISDSRGRIMGVAIIWILLFHLDGRFLVYGYFPGFLSQISAFLFDQGSIGVELFLLCSGFGPCFSFRKESGIQKSCSKRCNRDREKKSKPQCFKKQFFRCKENISPGTKEKEISCFLDRTCDIYSYSACFIFCIFKVYGCMS